MIRNDTVLLSSAYWSDFHKNKYRVSFPKGFDLAWTGTQKMASNVIARELKA
jgi:hypothetical protein